MKTTRTLFVVVGTIAMMACARGPREEQSIRTMLDNALHTFNGGDLEGYLKFHTVGAVVYAPGRNADVGIAAVRESDRRLFEKFRIDEKRSIEDIRVGNGWAVVTGAYDTKLVSKGDGATIRDSGHYVEVLTKERGDWKYARTMWNSDHQ